MKWGYARILPIKGAWTSIIASFGLLLFGINAIFAETVIADIVADYVPGVNAGDTVTPVASGTGTWRYLKSDTLNPTEAGANLADLEWDTMMNRFERPVFEHTDGYNQDTLGLAGGEILLHPAIDALGDAVVARWIVGVGESGLIDINGNARKIDIGGGDGVRLLIFIDGVSHFDQVIAFNDIQGVSIRLNNIAVNVGSTVDFVLSNFGDSQFDSTGLTSTATRITEPSIKIARDGTDSVVITYSGILQCSDNLVDWFDLSPQQASPWTFAPVEPGRFFRALIP